MFQLTQRKRWNCPNYKRAQDKLNNKQKLRSMRPTLRKCRLKPKGLKLKRRGNCWLRKQNNIRQGRSIRTSWLGSGMMTNLLNNRE